MALIVYDQQKNNAKILVQKLQAKKVNRNVIIALVVNSLHESYLNPWTLEGAINPGPPAGAQGTGPGGGLWQWTPYEGKVTLGDWDGQIDFMLSDAGQYIAHSAWWASAGVTEPDNSFNGWADFLANADNLDAVALTRIFIGNWERPGYTYGAERYNQAPADVEEVQAYVSGSGGGVSMPIPQWPFNYAVAFNQQPYEVHQPSEGFYDHDANQAYDIQAQDGGKQPYYAPADMTTVYVLESMATRVLMSDQKLYFADGQVGYLALDLAHDEDSSNYVVGKKFKAGEVMGHMGSAGAATGDHVHMAAARFAEYTEAVQWIKQGPYSAIVGGQISEIRGGDNLGNVTNAVTAPGFPNPWTSEEHEKQLGRVTLNNVFSVTDAQKAGMTNNFSSHVNIDGFKYIQSGEVDPTPTPTPTPKPPKPRHLKAQTIAVMGIFNN